MEKQVKKTEDVSGAKSAENGKKAIEAEKKLAGNDEKKKEEEEKKDAESWRNEG